MPEFRTSDFSFFLWKISKISKLPRDFSNLIAAIERTQFFASVRNFLEFLENFFLLTWLMTKWRLDSVFKIPHLVISQVNKKTFPKIPRNSLQTHKIAFFRLLQSDLKNLETILRFWKFSVGKMNSRMPEIPGAFGKFKISRDCDKIFQI